MREFPWGFETPDEQRLNFNSNLGGPTDVGRYSAGISFYGAADMAGNVWEWVADWYDASYYQKFSLDTPLDNPTGPNGGEQKVVRGGSWFTQSNGVQATRRQFFQEEDARNDQTGFRCVVPAGD